MEEYYEYCNEELIMDEEELATFFSKYDALDLYGIGKILNNVNYTDYDVTNEQKILSLVADLKNYQYALDCIENNFDYNDEILKYDISLISRNNKELTDKELKFLFMMTEYSSAFISLALNYLENNYDKEDEILLNQIDLLKKSLHEEIYSRFHNKTIKLS